MPTSAEQLDGFRAQSGAAFPLLSDSSPASRLMDHQRLGDNLEHVHARIQGGVGVLEDGLHLAAQTVQLGR